MYGNFAEIAAISDFFEGLHEKGKAYVKKLDTRLNKDYQDEKINDLQAIEIRAHANIDMGIANAATALGSKYFDLLDAEVDAIIGNHPATRFFDFGKDAKKRTEKRKQTIVAAAKTIAGKGLEVGKKTIERPGGSIADASVFLYQGGKDYLYETFWEGDLNKTSALAGNLIESLIPGKLVDDALGLAKYASRTPDILGDASKGGQVLDGGYEYFYRSMYKAEYEEFIKTGKVPATRSEKMISPNQHFAEAYEGVLVKFQMGSGSTERHHNK